MQVPARGSRALPRAGSSSVAERTRRCTASFATRTATGETLFSDVMDDDTKEDSRRASSNATAEQQPKPAPDSVNGDIIVKFNNMGFGAG